MRYAALAAALIVYIGFTTGCSIGTHAGCRCGKNETTIIQLKIVDQNGTPIAGIEGGYKKTKFNKDGEAQCSDYGWELFTSSIDDGELVIESKCPCDFCDNTDGNIGFQIFLKGNDRTPVRMNLLESEIPDTITLAKGVKVNLTLEGKTVKGKPRISLANNQWQVLYDNSYTFVDLMQLSDNSWECILKPGEEYVIGWVSDNIYGYISEPFTAGEGKNVTFSPGMPATFEYDLRGCPKDLEFPISVFLTLKVDDNFLSYGDDVLLKKPGIVRFKGKAHGDYQLSGQSSELFKGKLEIYDRREIKLEPGQTNYFKAKWPVTDTSVQPGDMTIKGQVVDTDGNGLAKKIINFSPRNKNGFPDPYLYIPPVKTDRNGYFEFCGISPDINHAYLESDGTSAFIASNYIEKNTTVSVLLTQGVNYYKCNIGSKIIDFKIIWTDGRSNNCFDFTEDILVMDIWGTHCGPCRRGMPKFIDLSNKYSKYKNIKFVAACTDRSIGIWKKTLEQNKWNHDIQGLYDPINKNRLETPIPLYLVLDKDRIAKYSGHDLEKAEEIIKKLIGN